MFNLDDLVPGETVLISDSGNERHLLARNGEAIWTECLGIHATYFPEEYKNWTIKQPGLDPTMLEPGDRLRDTDGVERVYIAQRGEYLIGGLEWSNKIIDLRGYSKKQWRTWKKVEG